MSFFEEFMSFFEDEDLREEFLDFLLPERDSEVYEEKMVTGHISDEGDMVFSVFSMEEWAMICEMSLIVQKPTEDIIKDLGPDEVLQLYVKPNRDQDN